MDNTTPYTCMLVDDEPVALKILNDYVSQIDDLQCVGQYSSAIDAVQALQQGSCDLLFLDINMPGLSGMDLVKSLKNPPPIVFTTAYREFAADAFDLDALDYLVKPVAFARFLKAWDKFLEYANARQPTGITESSGSDYVNLLADKKYHRVLISEIQYLQSLDNYVKVYTTRGVLICYERLSAMEARLSGSQFLRIHRSYLVNVAHVGAFTSAHVDLADTTLPIGRSYRKEVLQLLNKEQ